MSEVMAAASAIGVKIDLVRASDSREIESCLRDACPQQVDALLVGTDPFFYSRRVQLATLASRHVIPAIYTRARTWRSAA